MLTACALRPLDSYCDAARRSLDQVAKLWTSVPGTIEFECTQTYQVLLQATQLHSSCALFSTHGMLQVSTLGHFRTQHNALSLTSPVRTPKMSRGTIDTSTASRSSHRRLSLPRGSLLRHLLTPTSVPRPSLLPAHVHCHLGHTCLLATAACQ